MTPCGAIDNSFSLSLSIHPYFSYSVFDAIVDSYIDKLRQIVLPTGIGITSIPRDWMQFTITPIMCIQQVSMAGTLVSLQGTRTRKVNSLEWSQSG
jgi:hypothetical protein